MAAKRKYNWDGLFDRQHTVLVRGADYHCSQSTMAGMIRNQASGRGVRVCLTDTGDSIIVEVANEVSHTDQVAVTS